MRKFQQRRIPTYDDSGIRKEEMRSDRWLKQAATELGKLGAGNTKPPALLVPSAINPPPISGEFWLLRGRPGGQLGYGGTGSGQSATIASTTHPTKGKVYFGAAQNTAYDETNERFGVAQPIPLARLHVKVPNPAQTLLPDSCPSIDSWVNESGVGTGVAITASLLDPDTVNYARHGNTNGTLVVSFVGYTYPGVTSGHVLTIIARSTEPLEDTVAGIDMYMNAGADNIFSTKLLPTDFLPAPPGLTNGFDTYEYTLSAGEVALMAASSGDIRISINRHHGTPNASQFTDIAYIKFEAPSGGAGAGEPLQKWENDTYTDTLEFAGDGSGTAFDLLLSGTGALRVGLGGGTSGIRLLTSSTNGRVEAGSSAAANMNLVLSGTRATQGTLLTIDFVNALLKGALQFEDPGAGTNTIGITSPASPTTHVLTLPAAIVNLGFLQVVTGGALAWVTLSASSFPHVILNSAVHTDTLTGTVVAGDIIIGNATPKWARLAIGATRKTLQVSGSGLPAWSFPLQPTGLNTGDLVYAQATDDMAGLADVATGNALLSGGLLTQPLWGKVGLTTHVSGRLPFANLTQGSARSVLGVAGNATADVASIQGTTAHDFLKVNSAGTGIGFETLIASMLPAHDHSSATQGGATVNLQDTTFTVFKSTGPTSKFRFDAAGLTVVGTYVFGWPTSPPSPATIVLAEGNNVFSGSNDFTVGAVSVTDTFFYILKSTDLAKSIQLSLAGLTAARVYTAPNAAGTLALTSDAGGSIDVARTWATLQTFADNTFKLVGSATASKTLVFELDSATASTDLTLSYETTNSRILRWILAGNAGNDLTFSWTGTADRTLTLPNVTATLAHLGSSAQTFAGPMTFNGAFTSTAGGTYSGSGSVTFQLGGGVQIADNSSAAGPFIFATPSAVNNANFTLPDLPNNSSFILKTGTDANAISGAGAAIASTNFAAAPNAGLYAIFWDLYVTTAGTSGTVTVTFSWTDDIGATSFTSNTLALGPTTGRYPVGTNQPIVFRVASGAVSFNTTVAAVVGSPVHKVYARLVAL